MMRRYAGNPILTRESIPAIGPHLRDVSSVFNPGAVLFRGEHLLLLRVQNRGRETFWMRARSRDGLSFRVDPEQVRLEGLEKPGRTVYHVYDPRITRLDDQYYIFCAMDTEEGCVLGLVQTSDFERYSFIDVVSENEVRNGVLFPEMVGGRYLRLERPNELSEAAGVRTGSRIWLSESSDLLHWKRVAPVLEGRFHYWDEWIGSGPPPVRTAQGWLHLYHGVATHFASSNIYQVGVVLLDLKDPSRVLARSRYNIHEPRASYELTGQVPNVVFPSGWIVGRPEVEVSKDTEVKIYYGAADTVVGLALTTVGELLAACEPVPRG
jgi:beta-1,4-mannooligosaccharide/beta-1,4-mannosyl-N-acetylglucosamine phosphorylase